MKRAPTLFLVFILIVACSLANPTVTPPPATFEPASVPSSSVNMSLFYISGTSHVESKPNSWPQPDDFLAFLQRVTDLGMRWSVGADVGWLEQEPRAAEIIQKSEAMGVQWDVHAHEAADRAKVAYLITQMGGHPNSVVSGMLVTELDGLRQPQTYQGYTWTPRVLWGGTSCVLHRPGCDDNAAGIWIPLSSDQYQTHDPNGSLIRVGGGTHLLDDGRALAQSIAAGQYTYPIISFTVMVAPSTLEIVKTGDGLEQITLFVNEMNAFSFVRWGTIEETARSWVQAGSVPSRVEMP